MDYYYDETSKYDSVDTEEVLNARRFELLMGDIDEELQELYSKGVNNLDESTQLATQPPFEFRIAVEMARDILKRETKRIIDFMREEAVDILANRQDANESE